MKHQSEQQEFKSQNILMRMLFSSVCTKIFQDLDKLVDPITRSDPESALRWTCKSTTKLAKELQLKVIK